MQRVAESIAAEKEVIRLDLEQTVARFRSQLSTLLENALVSLRQSLDRKVIITDPEDDAAGTSFCISCRRDRSPSPRRNAAIGADGHVYGNMDPSGLETRAPSPPQPAPPLPERPASAPNARRRLIGVPTPVAASKFEFQLGSHEGRKPRPASATARPGSARGRGGDRYEQLLERYDRLVTKGNDNAIGKLVGVS